MEGRQSPDIPGLMFPSAAAAHGDVAAAAGAALETIENGDLRPCHVAQAVLTLPAECIWKAF